MTGVCGDDTKTLTHIAWHDSQAKVVDLIKTGDSFSLGNARIAACARQWSLTLDLLKRLANVHVHYLSTILNVRLLFLS